MSNLNPKPGIYFPNLNGLRFVAATAVIIQHIELNKQRYGLPNIAATSAVIGIIGKLGVVLFFVLSGFLITYLLLEEEHHTGQIRFGRFYIRRALRIWPLYYAVVISALFILPHISLFAVPDYGMVAAHKDLLLKIILFATFFANVVLANVGLVPFAALTWSIGTEEQFYLIWPVLMKYIRSKTGLMLGVIALYLAGRVLLESSSLGAGSWQRWIRGFYYYFNIDCMAIGGLAAVILHKKFKILIWVINLPIFYAALITTLVLLTRGITVPYLHYETYAMLFAVLILNFSANKSIGWSMEFEPCHYLGKISYGLYLLHPVAVVASIHLLGTVGWTRDVYLYPTCLLGTIGLAALSYRFFESPFLLLKHRFAVVVSGEDARTS